MPPLPSADAADAGSSVPPGGRSPVVTARLLRSRATREALWIPVEGASMGRTVRGGSRVRVEPAPAPRPGEVWAFCTADGALLVHRYRGPVGDRHRFQGDARVRPDDPVPADLLVGRVVELAGGRAPRGAWFGALQRRPRELVAVVTRRRRRRTGRVGAAAPSPAGAGSPPAPPPTGTRPAPRP